MDIRTFFFALAIAGISNSVFAQEQRPQQPQPQEQQQQPAADPYTELNKQVQEALRQRGLYNGPLNGVIGPNTQAAIAQFQVTWPMPVNGMLDDDTLAALGIAPAAASAGGTVDAPSPAQRQSGSSAEQAQAASATESKTPVPVEPQKDN